MMKVKPVKLGKTERMSFSRIDEVIEMPNLIEVQKNSYQWFLDEGLKEVFKDISAIGDYTGNLVLDFIDYRLDKQPKYTIKECKERDVTYAAPLRVTARLLNKETGEIKQQEVFMGDFPLMTDSGTFIINGAERVIVSQLVRSPGVFFDESYDKTGKKLFTATMNPNRGAWLEYETDSNDVFYVRIDKNRKLPVTTLVRALGLGTDAQILDYFGEDERILATLEKDVTKNEAEGLIECYKKLRPGEPPTVESAQNQIDMLFFDPRRYDLSKFGRYKMNRKLSLARRIEYFTAAENVIAPLTGEILITAGEQITREKALEADKAGVSVVWLDVEGKKVKVVTNGCVDAQPFFSFDVTECGINERCNFAQIRQILDETDGDVEKQKQLLEERHDQLICRTVTVDDIFSSINYLNGLDHGVGVTDDIDHLGNRRIRSVGELLQNQFRIGFSRMERVIRERMTLQAQDADGATPASLINIRPVVAAVKEFFGSSPLSQFMDQNNPLAELTHKRRLSALGPGGLSRDRAGFEVRDVHYSHYGRMCPIETPEGPNIGLISYLATFAKINKYGFVEAPYRKVKKIFDDEGKLIDEVVTDEVVYMTADVEDEYVVAQANEPLDEAGHFMKARVNARRRDDILEIEREKVDYMDVSPKMVVSVATAMIPFLENDDANRALMGSNMQRQAVPLMVTQQPIVATGMEYKAACDSGVCVLAKHDGVVERVDADKVIIRTSKTTTDEYELIKFMRSNQGTCVNQRPIVSVGEEVKAGQVIADGPATRNGEISLGKNALIGFMTWEGYNYEDAVLINEKIVREDVYTSIHIEEYEIEARENKLGPEEITRDIPNVGEDALKDLDERGIIRVGAEVNAGDILVGKVSPKGETELTAEERLLRAIFGEKAREVRDTSLRVPHGAYGIVVDVKVFTPDNCDELQPNVRQVVRCYIAQKRKISVGDKMAGRHGNKGVVSRILPQEDMPFLADGTPLDIVLNPLGVPSRMNIGQVLEVNLGYAAKALGWKVMTPVFDGAHESDIHEAFRTAAEQNHGENAPEYPTQLPKIMGERGHIIDFSKIELDEDGKSEVFDGRTGEKFDNRVTVGYMYYLKLHHLVDDKIHARSTGPYSLVTQQPLGGKAQFGGQRFGEMEVWALEAYGAAYTLQEILTVKSDDVVGRVKTYEAIVKGQDVPKPGIPESFRVLIKEMQSLGLDVSVLDAEGEEIDLKQNFDDEETGFDSRDMGDDVLLESELNDDYSIENADEGFEEEEEGPTAADMEDLFSDDGDAGILPEGEDF
ncbi:MAG: DNA-directed RNA polymerase subunit beta [Oscillospiraceae bacterium]|nr:DNA-directed RNA polymerase subunit beta [Bacteroidales bacterium]MDD6998901.1 DNA-directed RNA polymerase subunit beta [Oscillospiraceae bacterium]MDY5096106.1 DNA-directed RNA polymerase subunit beta [Oscillospiraceae bacterium]